MTMLIRNAKVVQLAEELARLTGETKTAAILHALEERRERLVMRTSGRPRVARVLDFLEGEVWPNIPRKFLGRYVTKKERERILGYGK